MASTASATASTPTTLTVAATVPAGSSATAVSGVVQTQAAPVGGNVGSGSGGVSSCPVVPALTVSACTAVQTVTVTALSGGSGVVAPTLAARHFHGHLKKRAVDF